MGINKKKFIEDFTSLGNEKGISNENLQQILADSFKVAFAKSALRLFLYPLSFLKLERLLNSSLFTLRSSLN